MSDAQRLLSDAQYLKRGVAFDDRDSGIARTTNTGGDVFYAVDTAGGDRTVTLPDVKEAAGQVHTVKRVTGGGNACTIATDAGSIDGAATLGLPDPYDCAILYSDGEAWHRLNP